MRRDEDRERTEVEALLGEWAERGPHDDVETFVARHPEHATALRDALGLTPLVGDAFEDRAPLPERVGPYRIDRELGTGGMGTVYRAVVAEATRALPAGRTVALKVVHPHLFRTPGFFKRFLREADLGRRIDHPNVVRTLDADAVEADGRTTHYLVMEYVEGRTLRDLLEELERVPEELARHVGREVAKGLAAIHAAGAVHRDLKPENVILTPDHAVKVMDLGVARLAGGEARLSQTGVFVGSLQYAAPEQMRGGDGVDQRADLHALGLLLYELAAGANPYFDEDARVAMRRILAEAPRRLGEVNSQVSPFFEELVHTLLAKEPEKRLASATETLAVLEEGEGSAWWKTRALAIRTTTLRPLRRIRVPRETALYGREAELARLRDLYERAKSGEGQVVLVEGEAGIGKSRLVDEFVAQIRAAGEDVNFLFGSYPPGGAATASGAFSTAYREHFGHEGLEEALRGHLTVTPVLVPAFAALLRGDAAPQGSEPLTKDSLQTVFVHATRSLAAERPTIVAIEDLHFAPEEGRALFASLAHAVPGHRVLLVGTTRPGVPEAWTAGVTRLEHTATLQIPRLSPKDLVRLLGDTFRSERLAEELGGKIALKSDGNPFFVFEIVRGLREGQFLRQRPDGTWETTRVIEDFTVPSSILDLVNARVADLDDADRNLLDVAACCGFEFDAGLVGDALGHARLAVLQQLAKIEKRHRLVRAAGHRFAFDHHQVQEALYGALPPPLREEYHTALGDALERRSGSAAESPKDVDGALCVDLAEHFLRGTSRERAVRYLVAAMDHLHDGALHEAELALADRALAVPGLLGAERRAVVLRRLGGAGGPLDMLGHRTRQRAACEEALTLSRESADRKGEADAEWGIARCDEEQGRFASARVHATRAADVAREAGDVRLEISAILCLADVASGEGGYDEARSHCERARELAQSSGDRDTERSATSLWADALHALGRHEEAAAALGRARSLCRDSGNRASEAVIDATLANVARALGRYADAREHYERALAIDRQTGARRGQAIRLVNLGALLAFLGDRAAARSALESALRLGREVDTPYTAAYALYELARLAEEDGDAALALRLHDESLSLRRRIGAAGRVADSLLQIGRLRIDEGDESGARAAIDESLGLLRAQGRASQIALAEALLARLPGGSVEGARAALERAGPTGNTLRTRYVLWQAGGDPSDLGEAKRLLDRLVAQSPDESRGPMLANFRLHREIVAAAREMALRPTTGDPAASGPAAS